MSWWCVRAEGTLQFSRNYHLFHKHNHPNLATPFCMVALELLESSGRDVTYTRAQSPCWGQEGQNPSGISWRREKVICEWKITKLNLLADKELVLPASDLCLIGFNIFLFVCFKLFFFKSMALKIVSFVWFADKTKLKVKLIQSIQKPHSKMSVVFIK